MGNGIIRFPCFEIVIMVYHGRPAITSNLREPCRKCGQDVCNCVGFPTAYNHRCDGIESLILTAALQGIDVESPQFVRAVQAAVRSVSREKAIGGQRRGR